MEQPDIRPSSPDDVPKIVNLCRRALGWSDDPVHDAFFRWKHVDNPFGPSHLWVAEADGHIVAVRAFMRWQFVDPLPPDMPLPHLAGVDPSIRRAARAVDTATDPEFQGQGLFTALTRHALAELEGEVDFVFNTPNDQSLPGYLKMGWTKVGRQPISMVRRSSRALGKVARANAPADKWSVPTDVGLSAAEAFGDDDIVKNLLDQMPSERGLATHHSPAFLRWRYGFEPLHYRVALVGDTIASGAIVFRLRQRGAATELAVGRVFMPRSTRVGPTVRRLLKRTGADYAVMLGADRRAGVGIPVPGQGPLLTHRVVTEGPNAHVAHWSLTLGDVELF